MTTVRLMLAGGTGRLVRRPSVVLFDPTGQNQELANRFDAAESDSDAVDGLKKYLIESGFTAAPLVIAQWARGEFNLLVFGDVQVHTSAIAAPMVSGAGSSTWVERHLGEIELGGATNVEVWSGAAADPTTNLGLGVVACAGFRMSLDLADLLDDVGAGVAGVADATIATTTAAQVLAAGTVEVPQPVAVPIAAPMPGHAKSEWVDTEDLTDVGDVAPVPESGFDDGSVTQAAPVPPVPPVPAADPFAGAGDEPVRAGLIEAAHCPQGHANPPMGASCYVCGESLIEDQSLGLIEQPSVGRIVFGGGQIVALDRTIVLGRKPDVGDTDAHPVLIDHDEVSRSHAQISTQGWTVLLTDTGSRNGTWVSPASDPTPVRLDAQVPHVLEHGTTVHLGAPEVSFVYFFDSQ